MAVWTNISKTIFARSAGKLPDLHIITGVFLRRKDTETVHRVFFLGGGGLISNISSPAKLILAEKFL